MELFDQQAPFDKDNDIMQNELLSLAGFFILLLQRSACRNAMQNDLLDDAEKSASTFINADCMQESVFGMQMSSTSLQEEGKQS